MAKVMYLDIETRKVPVAPAYHPNERDRQRPVTKRWQTFMVGVGFALPEQPLLIEGDERAIMKQLADLIKERGVTHIIYTATRQFDEMVLRGRFINARRELLVAPGPWPRLLNADACEWTCLRPLPNPDPEGSRMAPTWYDSGDAHLREKVRAHCLADVTRLMTECPVCGETDGNGCSECCAAPSEVE
jgi:hypothetical protein